MIITNIFGSTTSSIATLTVVHSMVVAWGDNTYGQTNVPPTLTNAIAVSGGFYHSLALQADGTVVAWGFNGDGQTNVPPGLRVLWQSLQAATTIWLCKPIQPLQPGDGMAQAKPACLPV